LAVIALSGTINLLALTSSLYMLQLYDRVLPSHSVPTLVALTLLMLLLYIAFGLFEWVRGRITSRLAARLDRTLRARVFGSVLALALQKRRRADGPQPVSDLDRVRTFVAGVGAVALVDLPWSPLYLGIVFLLHPWLGALALAGAILLVVLTLLTELRSRAPMRAATTSGAHRSRFLEASRRNSEAIRALGMTARLSERWNELSEVHLKDQRTASDIAGSQGAVSRVVRLVIQSAVLGLGAYLVIAGEATGGVMIAASILASRALAPVDVAIANWREFVAARQGAARLAQVLAMVPAESTRLELPPPSRSLEVEGLWVAAPGDSAPIIRNVSLKLAAGSALGVIGPSAAGKSTLVRALVGAWTPLRGTIRLDGADLPQWPPEQLGAHVGYLPQDIELFDGTVAQNIARFGEAEPSKIIDAAVAAGIHDMVVHLRDGYDTEIGEDGTALSAGQRQRIGLARALFGQPFLVILDEPNAHLDAAGDAALTRAIAAAKARGAVVIVVAHRPSALAACDLVLAMADGQVGAFGPKDETLRRVLHEVPPPSTRLKVVAEGQQGTQQGTGS